MSALFFDIDGTILSEITHKIPESALEALHKAQENGHKTFINTGRTICSVPPMIKRISFDGFLCGCGTHLIYGEQVVFHHSIPYERGREIIKSMKELEAQNKELLLNKARLEATLEESLLDGKKPVKKSAHASNGANDSSDK